MGGLRKCEDIWGERAFFLCFLDFPGALRALRKRAKKGRKMAEKGPFRLISGKGGQTPLKPPFVTPSFAAAQEGKREDLGSSLRGKTPWVDSTCADCSGSPVPGAAGAQAPSFVQVNWHSICLMAPFEQILGSAARSSPATCAKTGRTEQILHYHPGRNYYKIIPWNKSFAILFVIITNIIPPEHFLRNVAATGLSMYAREHAKAFALQRDCFVISTR